MASEGPLESFGRTGQGLLAAATLPFAPVQGVVRSLIGHPIAAADEALRRGAVALYGEDKVRAAEQASEATPGGMTYDEARRNADTALSLIAPRGGLAAARPPASSAPPLPSPETPPPLQIAENKAAIAAAIRNVSVPPERIDPADIEGLARSVTRRDLLTFGAFRRAVIGDALKRGLVTPEEVEQIYGKGAADEYRGRATPTNGAAAPPQGTQRGGPRSDAPEGQQLPGPGENGGETRGPTTASPEPAPTIPQPRGAEGGEPTRPVESRPSSSTEGVAPNNIARPEETARADGITPNPTDTESSGMQAVEFPQQPVDAGTAPAVRARIISGQLGGARIQAPEKIFDWIGIESVEFFANFEYLQRKHPEYFSRPGTRATMSLTFLQTRTRQFIRGVERLPWLPGMETTT